MPPATATSTPTSPTFPTAVRDDTALAQQAVEALIAEVGTAGVPGRAVGRDPGALRWAAMALFPGFEAMAAAARRTGEVTQDLREELGAIGRSTEWTGTRAGCGVRAHRGAIWAVGLLVAGAALAPDDPAAPAKRLAALRDRRAPLRASRGSTVSAKYGAAGARGEARAGFPHVRRGLAALGTSRRRGAGEQDARLDALLTIMCTLQDTSLLHTGGPQGLRVAKNGAQAVLDAGGATTPEGRTALRALDTELRAQGLTPSGSAPLLAGVLFLDGLASRYGYVRAAHRSSTLASRQ